MRKLYWPDILDPLGTGSGGPPSDPPEPRTKRAGYVICDHCGCQLTQGGEVFKMSDLAKRQNKQADTIAELKADVARLTTELEAATTRPTPEAVPVGDGERKTSWL